MIKDTLLIIFLLFAVFSVKSQDYKFGKVSKEELTEKVYAKDSSAPAAVLYRSHKTRFNYLQSNGFQIITFIYERVKIYNADGFKYATVKENLFYNKGQNEHLTGLKAYTYNLVDGKIVKDKLKSSAEFKTKLNDFYNQEKFTMPNVNDGSVIEYQYSISSPFYWSIDELVLQYDIPIKKQEVSISTPEYFVFKPNIKGYLKLNPRVGSGNGKMNFINSNKQRRGNARYNYDQTELDYSTSVNTYEMIDVPALEAEPFINNINNYRSVVKYELESVKMPDSPVKNYTTTWEDVIDEIYQSQRFGGQLTQGNFFKDDLSVILADKNSDIEKTGAIFHFIQDRMNWDGYYGYYVNQGVRKAYKEKKGNTADINLMLIAMLNDAGVKSYPVLISTRENGVPMFPTREGFNYVAVYVELDKGSILLDASNKYTEPNLLPARAINWFGQVVKKDGTRKSISLIPKTVSKETLTCSLFLTEDGEITGKQRTVYSDYLAYNHRNDFNGVSDESYIKNLESKTGGIEISEFSVKNQLIIGKPITESYAFLMENQASSIGDKIYFNPLFHFATKENPFKLEERYFPIDFKYPWEEKYNISINIPEGYVIESIPESLKLELPDKMGSFLYTLKVNSTGLQVLVDIKFNNSIIPSKQYQFIKEFFNQIVQKETEQVVLSKS
ncbi:DUF3857 domain-containing protein [Maribacter antarcticus]|uniref:DUF3857 domain-containing protein n=1 Tax=Maribacter antarcticus TaxID=505250 RepID=UPI000684F8FE|nr:DUF3857 domain-containing protein [Maribacter antarcticus]